MIDTYKKMSSKKIYDITCILIGCALLMIAIKNIGYVDNDFYFLAATGDEIIAQGKVFETNPFFIFKNRPFTIQQWSWCVLCSWLKQFGNIGIAIQQIIQLTVLEVLLFMLLKIKKINRYENSYTQNPGSAQIFMMANIAVWGMYGFSISSRPECITVILLLLQVYATEQFLQSRKRSWLALLPLSTFIEINVHSSIWIMHFCVLIPYVLPFVKSKARASVKPFIIPMLAMIGSLFINPLGYKAVWFITETFLMKTFEAGSNSELNTFLYLPLPYLMLVIFLIGKFITSIKKQILSSEEFYISAGLLFMTVMQMRNVMFMPLLCFYFFPHWMYILTPEIKVQKVKDFLQSKEKIILTCLGFITIVFVINNMLAKGIPLKTDIYDSEITRDVSAPCINISAYIEKHDGISAKIMTPYNLGGYFEMRGYRNLYIDARPESYAFPNSSALQNESVWAEYNKLYCNCANTCKNQFEFEWKSMTGQKMDFAAMDSEQKDAAVKKAVDKGLTYTDAEIEQILNTYDFDYYIVRDDSRLYYYMCHNNDYIILFDENDYDGHKYIFIKDTRKIR